MDKLLKANSTVVKAAMQQEKKEREAERKAKRSAEFPLDKLTKSVVASVKFSTFAKPPTMQSHVEPGSRLRC